MNFMCLRISLWLSHAKSTGPISFKILYQSMNHLGQFPFNNPFFKRTSSLGDERAEQMRSSQTGLKTKIENKHLYKYH